MKYLAGFLFLFFGVTCFAQATPVTPTDFLIQILQFVQSMGGAKWFVIAAGVISLLQSSMNLTALNSFWTKFGKWGGPILGLIGGILAPLASGTATTLGGVMSYILAGGVAIYIQDILNLVKAIPGVGAIVIAIINYVETLPFGAKPKAKVKAKR